MVLSTVFILKDTSGEQQDFLFEIRNRNLISKFKTHVLLYQGGHNQARSMVAAVTDNKQTVYNRALGYSRRLHVYRMKCSFIRENAIHDRLSHILVIDSLKATN